MADATKQTLAATFTRNLATLRRRKGFTQQETALRTNLSVSYVSMLERGQRVPTLDTIDRIASGFGVRALELLR